MGEEMATEMDHQIVRDLKAAGIDYITSVPSKQLAGVIEVLD
jgi:sulfopyruvate decarboxylase subunit alpha